MALAKRQWPTLASLKKGLEQAHGVAKEGDTVGLLMDEADLLPLIEAIEKRERRLQALTKLAKTNTDLAELRKLILSPLPS